MAVNGVKLSVGQNWETNSGACVKIVYRKEGSARPWLSDQGVSYCDRGRHHPSSDGKDSLDLKEPMDIGSLTASYNPTDYAALGHIYLSGRATAHPNTAHGTEAYGPNDTMCMLPHMDVPGYETLAAVLSRAYTQSATGKGAERHARENEPFEQQVILQGARRFGHGSLLYQAFKKSEESQRLPTQRAVAELLGAIVYLAGAVIALEEKAGAQ